MEWENYFNAARSGSHQPVRQDLQPLQSNGSGEPKDEYPNGGIDLNEQLIYNKPATFFYRMNGDAMAEAGIGNGDILIVDKSLKATNGKIIVASVNGELVVRRFQQTMKGPVLVAENARYENIDIGEFTQFNPFGLVTCVIRILEKGLLGAGRPAQGKQNRYGRR